MASVDDLQGFRPYVDLRNGRWQNYRILSIISLRNYAEKGPDGRLGVWSHKQFFALEL